MHQTIEGYRLSRQQMRLWRSQQQMPETPEMRRAQCAILIEGAIDAALLRQSVERTVVRHESLRTRYETLPGMDFPLQVVIDATDAIDWHETACRLETSGSVEEWAERVCRELGVKTELAQQKAVVAVLSEAEANTRILWLSLDSLSADAGTMNRLLREIAREYDCLSGKSLPDAADETLQYAQYSEWQAQLLEDENSDEALRFWQAARGRNDKPPALPFENKRPRSFEPARLAFALTPELANGILSLARKYEASSAIVLQACWNVWLRKASGQADICVQSLFNGRKYQELDEMLGLLAHSAPINTHLEDDYTFGEVLSLVKQTYQDALEWEEYFDPATLPEDSSSQHTQAVMCEFEEAAQPVVIAGLRFTMPWRWIPGEAYKIKLSCACAPPGVAGEDEFRLNLHYDSTIFSRGAVEAFGEQLMSLIGAAAANPEAKIASLDMLTAPDRQRLLSGLQRTVADYPADACVQQLFERQAELTPDALAVVYSDQELSYRQLNERANQLAHYLRQFGVGPETIVALYLNRSLEMMIGMLGALKAGAAYLPLDMNQPEQRLRLMMDDAAAPILLIVQGLAASWAAPETRVVRLDAEQEAINRQSVANPQVNCSPGNLAYLIYTSGTSGRPKAVMIQHGSVLNLAMGLRQTIYQGQPAPLRVSVNAPLAFDASVKQWGQLLSGHTLDIVPDELRADGERLADYLAEHRIEVLDCTPSQLRLLLRAGLSEREDLGLKLALVGGEALDKAVWARLASSSWEIEGFNVYGPTECTVDSTVCRISADVETPAIGHPLPNVQAYILDASFNPVPVGIAGELHIGGEGLSRGYLNRQDLTAEKFIPNPFSLEAGARLYRTGDLARYLPDGAIEFIGRVDHQVKLRGYRVELGEIEATLKRHPAVRDAIAIVQENDTDDPRLVAYVALDPDQATTIQGRARYELPNGLAVVHLNKNETDYLYHEIFENQTYFHHGITLEDEACVFDVGANIGMFTLFVNQICASPRIYAFEPLRPIFDTLSLNASLYADNVKLFNLGLSDSPREETFAYYPRYSMMSGVGKYADPEAEIEVIKSFMRNERSNGIKGVSGLLREADDLLAGRFQIEPHTAQLKTMSEVIRAENINRIDLLKIDVQRAELDVLKGIEAADWARIRQVVMEVHDGEGQETEGRIQAIETLLSRHGFTVWVEQDELLKGTDRYNLYARKETATNGTNGKRPLPSASPRQIATERRVVKSAELKIYLRERLPEHMVPPVIVQLDALPLTRNGKVDRAALPLPEQAGEAREPDHARPLTAVQEMLANIWSEVLRVESVGIDENFFDLGGHSLLATLLVSRIRNLFHIELPLRALFEKPTIGGLSEAVADALRAENGVADEPIVAVSRDGYLPLSFAQQRLWFLNQLEPDSPFYNVRHHLLLEGALDIPALERTFAEIIRRHETLRTNFIEVDGNPAQVITPASTFALPVLDLSHLEAADRRAAVRNHASEEVRRPFDLVRDSLMRVKLLRLDQEEHVLLYTMHHLISDGWSSSVLMREVAALYTAFVNGQPSPLAELPLQYADFAAWQRQHLDGARLEAHLGYWREQLADPPAELPLPTDRPRPLRPTFNSETQPVKLSAATTAALKALSRREGTTLFMSVLAAFQVLLSRYTGQEDIIVGSPVANRNRSEVENIIGFFVNTLVLRSDLSGDPTFCELMRRVRDMTLKAYAHQDLPFEKLVQEIQVRRDISRTPLFQTLMVFQNIPRQDFGLPGLSVSEIATEDRWSNFDLTLWMSEGPDGLTGVFEYNTDLFDAVTIRRMTERFLLLIEGIVSDPSQTISSLPLVDDIERDILLNTWNDTQRPYSGEETFIGIFESWVEREPEAIAVADALEELSYEELNRRANRVAHCLIEAGVAADTPVGLLIDRSAGFLTAKLGVLKSGGAMLLIDPRSPAARLQQIMEQSGTRHLLVERAMLPLAERIFELYGDREAPQALLLEESLANSNHDRNPCVPRDPKQLSYIIYTSGSTGVPKGAMIEDQGMLNHLYAKVRDLQVKETDRLAQTAPQSFDISVWQFLTALLVGGRVEVFDDNIAFDGTRLWAEAARRGVTILEVVPSLLRVMLEAEESSPGKKENGSGSQSPEEASTVRWLLLTGEALPPHLCQRWMERHPQVPLLNAYGPTECSDDVTHYEITEPPPPDLARMPIGRGVDNMSLYVVDNRLQLLPIGLYGELLVGGVGVGRGYMGDALRTAEVFIPDSYGAEAGARLYRTGDVVRWLNEGVLEYVARIDHQVKVRGNRIELGEIEAALAQHPAIQEVVADVKTDKNGERRIVAYVVTNDEVSLNAAEFRDYLKERLPGYMIPSAYVPLDRMPLTRNGKVDRRALPNPVETDRAEATVPPRNYIEETVLGIWREVLRVDGIGVHDNFFELGGHSLIATQVISRIRAALQIDLPLRSIFEQPTIASFASLVAEVQAEEQQREDADILNKLEQLSEEEIQRMLSQMSVGDVIGQFYDNAQTLEG
ncbi:MAG: amino acid adenylation domain-containing protein [Acidobacteriota bacterium]